MQIPRQWVVIIIAILVGVPLFTGTILYTLRNQKHSEYIKITTGKNLSPTVTPQEHAAISTNTIIATGVYNYLGAKTNISIQFPETGGRVTGNATDECNGSVTGVYDGKSVNGNATGTCRIFNNNLTSHGSYGGLVYKDLKKIVVSFQGTAESYYHKGIVTLYFK